MDLDEYFAEQFVKERRREAERLAATRAWSEPPGLRWQSLRMAVGLAMIRAGRWVLGQPVDGKPTALGR